MDTKQLEADVLEILRRDHPDYEWWASLNRRDGTLWVSLQATRLGVSQHHGYGCDPRAQFSTAEHIASNLDNMLYHLDAKTVPVIKALKAAGELRSDYPEYRYKPQEWIDEMQRLQEAWTNYSAMLSDPHHANLAGPRPNEPNA